MKKGETALQSKSDLPSSCLNLMDSEANNPNSLNRKAPSLINIGEPIPKNDPATPLHLALSNKREDFDIFLQENLEDINKQDYYGSTPLHLACLNPQENLREILSLLENKADIRIINNEGKTALELLIAIEPNTELLNTFINSANNTEVAVFFFQKFIRNNDLSSAIRTLNYRSDIIDTINTINNDGQTALHLACDNYDLNALTALANIPNLNYSPVNYFNQTPMSLLIEKIPASDETIHLHTLMANLPHPPTATDLAFAINCVKTYILGSFVLNKDENGEFAETIKATPLDMIALDINHLKYYLQLPNVDINAKDETGNTLLSYALNSIKDVAQSFIPPHIQFLLDHKADPNLTKDLHKINTNNHLLIRRLSAKKEEISVVKSGLGFFSQPHRKKNIPTHVPFEHPPKQSTKK